MHVETKPSSIPSYSDHSGRYEIGIVQQAFGMQSIQLVRHHEHSEWTDIEITLDTYDRQLADELVYHVSKLIADKVDPRPYLLSLRNDWTTQGGEVRIRLDNKPHDGAGFFNIPSPLKELVSGLIDTCWHLHRLYQTTRDPMAGAVARRTQELALNWLQRADPEVGPKYRSASDVLHAYRVRDEVQAAVDKRRQQQEEEEEKEDLNA